MDQQAKKHLQEEFDAALEEKDQMITVLQTQVRALRPQHNKNLLCLKEKMYKINVYSCAHRFT